MVIFTQIEALQEEAKQLAGTFHLTFLQDCSDSKKNLAEKDWFLELSEKGLELHAPAHTKFSPLLIDFSAFSQRSKQFNREDILARAITKNKKEVLNILDVTAGLGRDAFLLASIGHQLTLIERHPVLAAMLSVAISRAKKSGSQITDRMTFIFDDSEHYLSMLSEKPDVIYIDPMFPERTKSSLVKKDMQTLQQLVGAHDDSGLLTQALQKAQRRVVVKRPAKGEYLDGRVPTFQLMSKTHRFDIYCPELYLKRIKKKSRLFFS